LHLNVLGRKSRMLYPEYGGTNFLRNVANDLLEWTESCHRRENRKSPVIFGLSLIFFIFLAVRVIVYPVNCAIWCFCRRVNAIFALLGCYAASIGWLLRLLDTHHACPQGTTGLNLIWDRNPFSGSSNYWQDSLTRRIRTDCSQKTETKGDKETSRRVIPEWDKRLPNVTLRHVRSTTVTVENKYYIF
jgi:hypothetical protein